MYKYIYFYLSRENVILIILHEILYNETQFLQNKFMILRNVS